MNANDTAKVLYRMSRDWADAPGVAGSAQQARLALAPLLLQARSPEQFPAPLAPSVMDLAIPALLAIWQGCVAASQVPAAAVPQVAIIAAADPRASLDMLQKYSWLTSAAPQPPAASFMIGAAAAQLYLFPSPDKTSCLIGAGSTSDVWSEGAIEASPGGFSDKTAWIGGLLFILCLVLFGFSGYFTYQRASNPPTAVEQQTAANKAAAEGLLGSGKASNTVASAANCAAAHRLALASVDSRAAKPSTIDNFMGVCAAKVDAGRRANLMPQWLGAMASLIAIAALVGWGLKRDPFGILINARNRMSLSRLQLTAWTILILSAFWTSALWLAGVASIGDIPLPRLSSEMLALLGITAGTPIVGALILNAKANAAADGAGQPAPEFVSDEEEARQGALDARLGNHSWTFQDLFTGEEVSNRGTVDISRFQQFSITVILLMIFFVSAATILWNVPVHLGNGTSGPVSWQDWADNGAFPKLNTTFVWLLGISHAAYLTSKATPKTQTEVTGAKGAK